MIRNLKSYEDARDGAQFNGMNASIRKGGNQYRDSFSQYGTHQQSGHNLRDGMSYPSLNSLPLGVSPAAAVASATAANAPPQSSHYVQGTPLTSAVVSGTAGSLHGLTPHAGITTTTPTVLPLSNQHSQGPTPASTPPAAPNDPKTSGHYQQQAYNPPMMYNNYPRPPTLFYSSHTGATRNQTNRSMPHMPQGRLLVYPQIPYMQQIPMPTAPMAQNNNAVTSLVNHYQHEQYSGYYVPQQNPPSTQNFSLQSYQNYRPTSASTMRSTNPPISITNNNYPIQGAMMYNPTVSQITPLTQQTTVRPQKKERKKALKIINPDSGEEVKVDEANPNNTTNAEENEVLQAKTSAIAQFATEVGRRATEPSSNFTSSTTASSYAKKEPSPPAISNGPEKSVPSYLPETDWKSSSQANTAPSSIQTVNDSSISNIDPVVNLKSSNAASSTLQLTTMDYKRPTREEPSTTVTNDVDLATKPQPTPVTSWPENAVQQPTAAVTQAATVPPKSAASVVASAVMNKKIPKESETTAVSSSPVGSLASLPATVPSFTPSTDGPKAPSVTNTSVVLDDSNEMASKNTSKQGIQISVAVAAAADEDAAKQLPPQAAKSTSAATASSQSLPQVSPAPVTTSVPPPAQSNVTKVDSKATGTQQPTATQSPQNVKPSTSALQTSGPVSEKPSPIATPPAPFGQPFPSKASAPAASSAPNVAPIEKNAVVKDEKTNPSTKTKNRGKENTEANTDQNAKKSAQSVPAKHHNADAAKSGGANTTSNAAVASKQTNGEAADTQSNTEGKSKKNKKSSKKEMINKKGSEKEGSDMDVFTEKPSSPAEKPRNNEKTTAQTNNTSANRSNKTNSSQKFIDDKEEISAGEPKKELVNSQNIPSTQTVPASDLHKTEQTVVESRSKKYDMNFLLTLRDLPQCKKPVKIAAYVEHTLYVDQANSYANMNRSQGNFNMPNFNTFMPTFMNPGRGSMSLPTRKSQQGRMKNDRPTPIHVSLSLKEDVPLRHSKDAWKPARLNPDMKSLSTDEKKTQELYKSVTGILNKLTPEKFDTLLERIRNLPIDNVPRLQGVIDLIFEKAIDEPGFCKWYGEMCNVMQGVSVPDKETGKTYSFRTLLINKCQQNFERDKAEELDVIKKQEEIQACTDPEKKKELQLLYEDTERKVRRKSVGNCRFIGELFKLQMLTAKIMLRCIIKLLSSTDEESLECLCKLLSTIGKDLETKLGPGNKKELDSYFDKMLDLSENKKHRVSSRIRFMLQDVIDLRKNDWVPRREADNPKKIDQINTELERKEQEIKMMNMQPPRRQDDYYNRNRDYKKGTRTGSQNDDEWKTVKNYKAPNYKFDTNKLSAMHAPAADLIPESLGSASGFKKWSMGVATNKAADKKVSPYPSFSMEKQPQLNTSNSFRNLSNKVTPSSSMEKSRPYPGREENEAGKISRSGSAQSIHPSSRESSVPRQAPSRNVSQNARQSAPPMLNADQLSRACATIYQEYESNNDLKDSVEAFEERFNPKQVPEAVQIMLSHMIENKPKSAPKCGLLLANLIKRGTITKQHFIDALKFLVDLSEDLIIDCPKLWVFLADATNPLIYAEDCLQISELETIFPSSPLLEHVSNKPCSRNTEGVEDKDNTLRKLLLDCLNEAASDDNVKWIDENFENSRNSPSLVYKLTSAICQMVYDEWKKNGSEKADENLIEELMKKYKKFFKLYIENKGELEMQCLMAVHEFVDKADYPKGLLMKLFEFFYDYKLISYDSYIQWKNTDISRDRHRIGVALKSLHSFFEYIEEVQNEEPNN